MVRPVEQIEQEIARLDQAVGAIAQEFHDTYTPYLAALGKAVRQQLILASYHICTHGYPEQFLQLSLRQRQELQQSLRQLARQAQAYLADQLQTDLEADEPESEPENELESELESEPASEIGGEIRWETSNEPHVQQAGYAEFLSIESDESEADRADGTDGADAAEGDGIEAEMHQVNLADLLERSLDQPIHPRVLAEWQEQLEHNIIEQLQNLSHAANLMLQQGKILPSQLPEPILEVASRGDLVSESTIGPPNMISLLIEAEADDAAMTQITTIRLRLSEIEFSDTAVALWRSKVRNLVAQLNKLGREYQKRQKEKAIAQAESAWRSSWYEE